MILIVDDNEQVRQTIRMMIEDIESNICECDDGSKAFTAFVENKPDWVLMDLAMTGLDGLTATRQIVASYPLAKIVIVTSYDDPKLRLAATDAGASDYVVKENLIELRRVLGCGKD